MDALKIKAIELGSDRLYRADFLKRSWLANYVADVDTLVTAYEALQADCAALQAEVKQLRAVAEAARVYQSAVLGAHGIHVPWPPLEALFAGLDAEPRPEPVAESGPVTLSRTDSTTVRLTPRDPGRERTGAP